MNGVADLFMNMDAGFGVDHILLLHAARAQLHAGNAHGGGIDGRHAARRRRAYLQAVSRPGISFGMFDHLRIPLLPFYDL